MESDDLRKISFARRLDVLEMVYTSKAGHIGGSMSCMDILVALYYSVMDTSKILNNSPDRDRFILSKGHCAESLYAVLADVGFFLAEDLLSFSAFDSIFAEHPTKKIPGVEVATGALGHGLSIGVGMAIGQPDANVYVLMGDGELAEGSVWEAAMSAAKYRLGNLTVIVDRNRLQISGQTEIVMPLEDLTAKFAAFGWDTKECNGHEPSEIAYSLTQNRQADKPLALIAKTIKGYGSKIMENKADWHHRIPSPAEYEQIKADLQSATQEWRLYV